MAKAFAAGIVVTCASLCACLGEGSTTEAPPQEGSAFAALCGEQRAPARPLGRTTAETPMGSTRWYVIDSVRVGLTDIRTGARDRDAWKCYGFDLDGRATDATASKSSAGSCKRPAGSMSSSLTDGLGGVDNSFGEHILPLLEVLDPCMNDTNVESISSNFYLRLDGVSDSDSASVKGTLYAGRPSLSTPVSTGAGSAVGAQVVTGRPVASFPSGYVTQGVWVSGPSLAGSGTVLPLLVSYGLDLGLDNPTASASCPAKGVLNVPASTMVVSVRITDGTEGMMAGAISATEWRKSVNEWLGALGVQTGSALATTVVEALTADAPDLVLGAPNLQDESRTCDAISFGFAFTMKPAPTSPGAP